LACSETGQPTGGGLPIPPLVIHAPLSVALLLQPILIFLLVVCPPLGRGELEQAACFCYGDELGPPCDQVAYGMAVVPMHCLVLGSGAGELGHASLDGGVHLASLRL
jgi:hypothetical protein